MFTLVIVRAVGRRTVFKVRDDETKAIVFVSYSRKEAYEKQGQLMLLQKKAAA
jgi:hypothetical protein